MADDPPARRAQTADDRDLQGLAAKRERERKDAPAEGVPIAIGAEDEFTPVGPILEAIGRAPIAPNMRTELARLTILIWQHTANMEMRARLSLDASDVGELTTRMNELADSVVDISGKNGNNGKLGALKERVDKAESRRWWFVTALASAAIVLITSAIAIGRWVGEVNTDIKTLKAFHAKEGTR